MRIRDLLNGACISSWCQVCSLVHAEQQTGEALAQAEVLQWRALTSGHPLWAEAAAASAVPRPLQSLHGMP